MSEMNQKTWEQFLSSMNSEVNKKEIAANFKCLCRWKMKYRVMMPIWVSECEYTYQY